MTTTQKNKTVGKIAQATEFGASGAPVQTMPNVDPNSPAVDDDPRANTSRDQNRIDFNDPTLPDEEAVVRNLKEQG